MKASAASAQGSHFSVGILLLGVGFEVVRAEAVDFFAMGISWKIRGESNTSARHSAISLYFVQHPI